jgi:uncharacterized protein DUF5666
MMNRSIALSLAAFLAVAGPLLAHGGYRHVVGTVVAMDASHVEVKNHAGQTVSVKLSGATKFTRRGVAAAASDMQVGQRVSVEARPKGGDLEAEQVKLGIVPKLAPAK